MAGFATIEDLIALWRPLKPNETARAEQLLLIVSDNLRVEAERFGKNLDEMVTKNAAYANVVKSVTVDIVARTLMTSTDQEPLTQFSESALGYSVSGSFLVPGGGLFIKKNGARKIGAVAPTIRRNQSV